MKFWVNCELCHKWDFDQPHEAKAVLPRNCPLCLVNMLWLPYAGEYGLSMCCSCGIIGAALSRSCCGQFMILIE